MKRLLFLGAARFQCPPLLYARRAGYRVITVDNLPQNPGHRIAHESYTISTVDQAAILRLASDLGIDAIVSFASDVSAPTAAYVAARLGLPGAPPEVVDLLTDKGRFRQLLNRTGLQETRHIGVLADQRALAREFCAALDWQVVVKPVDSSGSKGVTILRAQDGFDAAFNYGLSYSRSGKVLVEERVDHVGRQVCGDGYMENGALAFVQFGDGHFYPVGPPAPWGETFPSQQDAHALGRLECKLEQVLVACGYLRGAFNLDAFITANGDPFVIEVGPRSGGNFIPSAIRYQTGVDMVKATVEGALSTDYMLEPACATDGRFHACYMVHSRQDGIFEKVEIAPAFPGRVVEDNPYVSAGEPIRPYRLGNEFIANLILSFDTASDMMSAFDDMPRYCRPILRTP